MPTSFPSIMQDTFNLMRNERQSVIKLLMLLLLLDLLVYYIGLSLMPPELSQLITDLLQGKTIDAPEIKGGFSGGVTFSMFIFTLFQFIFSVVSFMSIVVYIHHASTSRNVTLSSLIPSIITYSLRFFIIAIIVTFTLFSIMMILAAIGLMPLIAIVPLLVIGPLAFIPVIIVITNDSSFSVVKRSLQFFYSNLSICLLLMLCGLLLIGILLLISYFFSLLAVIIGLVAQTFGMLFINFVIQAFCYRLYSLRTQRNDISVT